MDGMQKGWYVNGQKAKVLIFNDDKLWTATVWQPNGEKCPMTKVVDGNGILINYSEDGSSVERTLVKDGDGTFIPGEE